MDKEITLAFVGLAGAVVGLLTAVIMKWEKIVEFLRGPKQPPPDIPPPPKPPSAGNGILSEGKTVQLIGTWIGEQRGERYTLDARLHLSPNGVEGEITWTLEDAGRNSWLRRRRQKGSKGVVRVRGSYRSNNLSVRGYEVDDTDLLGSGVEYEFSLTEYGKFHGRSHNVESGDGHMSGIAIC